MYVPKQIELLYLRFIRHKTVFGLSIILFAAITLFFPVIYPGELSMENIVIYYERFIGEITYDNPGFHLWTIISAGLIVSTYFPLVSILIGVNTLPFAEKDGKELLFSTPRSLIRSYLENSLLVILLIFLLCIPSFIFSAIFLIINNSPDSIANLTISFVLGGFLAIFIALLTTFGCTITFSKKMGYCIGGGYTILGFFSDMALKGNKDLEFIMNLNMFSKAKITQNAISGTWNEEFLFLILIFSVILILLSIFMLYRKDFIEGISKTSSSIESEQEKRKIGEKFLFLRAPAEKLISKLGWKFAALTDQLFSIAGLLTIFSVIVVALTIMQASGYQGEAETAMTLASIDLPFIDAAVFNYELIPTFEGWFTLEFLAWAWMIPFGPYILIVTNNIIFRDKKNRIAEVTWTLPKSEKRVILNRTIAALVGLVILFLIGLISYIFADIAMENNGDLINASASYLIFAWGYCVFFIIFLSLALIVPYKHAQKTLLLGFTISVLLLLAGFIADNFLLLALTPLSYFDYMGIFLAEKTLIDVLPNAFFCTFIAIVFYAVVLNKIIPARDRLV